MASLYIKDSETAALVARLAERRGITKTEAVRCAVEGELARDTPRLSAREVLTAFDRRYPLPEPTGQKADKAFFDELSGNL
jgi:antitoxin VapB